MRARSRSEAHSFFSAIIRRGQWNNCFCELVRRYFGKKNARENRGGYSFQLSLRVSLSFFFFFRIEHTSRVRANPQSNSHPESSLRYNLWPARARALSMGRSFRVPLARIRILVDRGATIRDRRVSPVCLSKERERKRVARPLFLLYLV